MVIVHAVALRQQKNTTIPILIQILILNPQLLCRSKFKEFRVDVFAIPHQAQL